IEEPHVSRLSAIAADKLRASGDSPLKTEANLAQWAISPIAKPPSRVRPRCWAPQGAPAIHRNSCVEQRCPLAEVFNVTKRNEVGRQANKRIRRAGQIPAVLYGHGEATVSLAIKRDEVAAALRHSGKVVDLKGDITDSALIRAVQWDPFGIEVLHVDLM